MSSKRRTHQSRAKLRRKLKIPARAHKLPDERLIADIEAMLARAHSAIDALEARLPKTGRPRELTVHRLLLWLMVLMRTRQRLAVTDFDDLVLSAPAETGRRLGLTRADGRPFNSKQVWRLFHRVAEALDPTGTSCALEPDRRPTLTAVEQDQRRAALVAFSNELIAASIPNWLDHDSGGYVVDGTTKWAFSKPRYRGLERPAGNDKTAVLTMADLAADGDIDLDAAGFADTDRPETTNKALSEHDPDARYLGRKADKAVFGYMLHTVVRVASDQPILIERGRTTTVTAHPAKSVTPILAALARDRATDPRTAARIARGDAKALGDIGADCGYSQAKVEDWYLAIRALGGNPIARLHSQNQSGVHQRHPDVTFCDGEPVCDCIPQAYTEIRHPRPGAPEEDHQAFQRAIIERDRRYGYRPNGRPRPDGSRQFLAPHHHSDRPGGPGGCEHCVDAAGHPVPDPTTGLPRPRCCTKRSYVFTAEQLALYQEPRYGTPAWRDRNVLRNRVEAGNSILKSTDIVRWGKHDSHAYRGLAFESLIAALAIAVVNLEQLENWEITEIATHPNRGGRPRNPGLDRYLPTPLDATPATAHDPP